jgi:ribosome-associated heat shock protein Hsp15
MRIDKYLWCVRLCKTRSQATDLVKKGKVRINEAEIKPSREVKTNDVVSVIRHSAKFQYKIVDLPKSRLGPKLTSGFIIDITTPEELNKFELYLESQKTYRSFGDGKPTKKDRRDLDDFWDDFLEF